MTYEFEDNYQKPKSKIEKVFEELKTAQLSTPRVISQSIKKDLKDENQTFKFGCLTTQLLRIIKVFF